MAISAISDSTCANSPAIISSAGSQQRLRSLLSVAGHGTRLISDGDIQNAAALLVSEMAFKPMLEEMRKTKFGSAFLDGGRTEEIFGQQLDERMADIAARSGRNGMMEQIARVLTPRPERLGTDSDEPRASTSAATYSQGVGENARADSVRVLA